MGDKTLQKRAVALRYQPETDSAPKIIAKGKGYLAQQIEEFAEQNNIPIQENNELINYLMKLELYQEIPPELYQVIAELLVFIYNMDNNYSKENRNV